MRLGHCKRSIRALTWLLVSLLFATTGLATEPIGVAGNVVSKETQRPISGFSVGLYPNEKQQGGQLSNGTTNDAGVYNMHAADIGQSVTEVWVVSETNYRKARPVWVDLRPNRQAAIASDALRVGSQKDALSSNEPAKSAEYAAAVFETRGIQAYSGALSNRDAVQLAFDDTSPLFAEQKRLKGNLEGFWKSVFDSFQAPIKKNQDLWFEVQDIYKAVFEMNRSEVVFT
jgi:hypothetical protein